MKTWPIFLMIILFASSISGFARDFSDIENGIKDIVITRDPENHPTRSYEETRGDYNYGAPYRATSVFKSQSDKGDNLILYINALLYPEIENSISNIYVPAVEADGWTVTVKTISGGDEIALRNTMKSDYDNVGYFHGILIGDLPIPWFYLEKDFDEPQSATFPIDLYYMDLDGEWRDDLLSDGIFDYHEDGTGDVEADIPVARWTTSPLIFSTMGEAELITNYIDKNVAYRNRQMIPDEPGLAYIDDDWRGSAPGWGYEVNVAFPGTETVYDEYETNAEDYEDNRLPTSYEHILACVHSSYASHYWYVNGSYSQTTAYELYDIESHSVSYNMFACSNSLYTENNYMGGWYCFMDNEWGVFSVGCTKSGSMLYFEDFYSPLSQGDTYGEAFQYWFDINAETYINVNYSRSWFYGMTLNGDPTLRTLEYTTAVALTEFWADPVDKTVKLKWEYSDDGEDVGFNIYRRVINADSKNNIRFGKIDEIRLNDGLIVGASPFTFVDNDVTFDTEYEYRLEMIVNSSVDGEATAYASTSPPTKTSFGLIGVYPNPVVDEVKFEYVIPENSAGDLSIFDISGRKIYSAEINNSRGIITVNTGGSDFSAISNGLYIVRLESGDKTAVKKFVISR